MNFSRFQRPSRYIDSEINVIRDDAPLRMALAFPDIYDVGMSHLGLRILYDIVNALPHARAERVFHPWTDMEAEIVAKGIPLSSLESGRPLREFDLVGFSLQYELSYTTVLNMLRLGGIPLRAADRGADDPLVIGGGPCTVNPFPVAPFFDAFLVGDGEEAVVEVLDVLRTWKAEGDGRRESVLHSLAGVPGVYVPGVSAGVTRRYIESLEDSPVPLRPLVPFTEIVHDRLNIEVSRGCTMGCRFCQAGMIYRPLRERSPRQVLRIAEQALASTGYEEIAFTSLSAGDYSCLPQLLGSFNRRFAGQMVAVSLPSLRVKAVSEDVLREIRSVRKTGFTIAPEAATSRLRAVINKDFSEEDYDRAVEMLFREGWHNLKLYFMVGLPTERDEDVEAIEGMVRRALRTARRHTRRFVNLSVSISPFVPKAHTPFQWVGQAPLEHIERKKAFLRDRLRKVNLKGHDERMSLLEAAFARGDENLAALLEAAHADGARLDGWTEHFSYTRWLGAMERTGLDVEAYAQRSFEPGAPLPWDSVDVGVTKDFLRREYERSLRAEGTEDCRVSCTACGLGCTEPSLAPPEAPELVRSPQPRPAQRQPIKVRAQFSKTGLMRHLSHRELMTHVGRALRRAGVKLEYSKGFHPSPRLAFGPPLGVGVAGLGEYFDMELVPAVALSSLVERINNELAEGVRVHALAPVGRQAPSLQEFVSRYEYEVSPVDPSEVRGFLALERILAERDRGPVDLRPMVVGIEEASPRSVRITLDDLPEVKVRLDEILQAVFGRDTTELDVTRLAMSGREGERWAPPLEVKDPWQAAS